MTTKTLLKITTLLGLLAWGLPAHASKFSDLGVFSSSGTYFIGYPDNAGSLTPARGKDAVLISSGAALVHSTSTTSGHKVLRVKNAAGTDVLSVTQGGNTTGTFVGDITGNVTGNASGTAGSLAANGANCSSGNYPLGVDASGAAESCTAAGIGDAVLNSTQTFSGTNGFSGAILSSGAFTTVNRSSMTVSSQTMVYGMWQIVDSTTPTGGVASWTSTFDTALSTSMVLELDFTTAGTSDNGDLYIRFNGDSGNNYSWGVNLIADNGAGAGIDAAAATAQCMLHRTTYFDGGDVAQGKVRCHIYPNASMRAMCAIEVTLTSAALGRGEGGSGICRYLGSAAITSITLGRTAGTWYGRATRLLLRTN